MAKQSFDKAMKQLEEIVHELELGELPLEKAMIKFEEGIHLANYCGELLDKTDNGVNHHPRKHHQAVGHFA